MHFKLCIFQTNNKKYLTNMHQREIDHDFKVHGIFMSSFSLQCFYQLCLGSVEGGAKSGEVTDKVITYTEHFRHNGLSYQLHSMPCKGTR